MEKLSNYKAVILAGGKSTRLYPVTREIPKPLLLIKRKPIINYLVDLFLLYEIKEIAVLINKEYKEDFIWWKKRYYPESNIVFVEETEPLGTFGGLWLLKDWIKNDSFFLTNGDELKEIDLGKMVSFHDTIKPVITIGLVEVPNPKDYGVAICEGDKIKEFIEKPQNPPSNYINSGIYLLSSDIFKYHTGPKFLMIEKDIFPVLAKEGKLAGFKFSGKWTDTGTWDRYSSALDNW